MVLMLIAELLAGETLVSPAGPVDALTACGDEPEIMGCRPPEPASVAVRVDEAAHASADEVATAGR